MNEKVSVINNSYINQFRSGLNQYVLLSEQRPYDSLEKYRSMMWRLGMLVEIWSDIEASSKEKRHG